MHVNQNELSRQKFFRYSIVSLMIVLLLLPVTLHYAFKYSFDISSYPVLKMLPFVRTMASQSEFPGVASLSALIAVLSPTILVGLFAIRGLPLSLTAHLGLWSPARRWVTTLGLLAIVLATLSAEPSAHRFSSRVTDLSHLVDSSPVVLGLLLAGVGLLIFYFGVLVITNVTHLTRR